MYSSRDRFYKTEIVSEHPTSNVVNKESSLKIPSVQDLYSWILSLSL